MPRGTRGHAERRAGAPALVYKVPSTGAQPAPMAMTLCLLQGPVGEQGEAMKARSPKENVIVHVQTLQ